MGKKQQKGGRRQILQLEDKKPPKSSPKLSKKNLIHYSDSDDDSKISNDSEHSSVMGKDSSCPLDTQVADFFKEIDALTFIEAPENTSENTQPPEKELAKETVTEVLNTEPNCTLKPTEDTCNKETDAAVGSYCSWQEIRDDSTGYSYYWNVETNEVTWDCPDEYAAYISYMNSTSADVEKPKGDETKTESLKKLQKKKESQLKEGSIIPISYFGGSSSSDESSGSEKSKIKTSSKKKKVEKGTLGNKVKANKLEEVKSGNGLSSSSNEIIGPQLPPDFQFIQDVSTTTEKSEDVVNVMKSTCQNEVTSTPDSICSNETDNSSISFSQSNLNEILVESLSSELLEKELKTKEMNLIGKKAQEESLNSTVKQGDTLKTSLGSRLVVEYDSFTDEDEEIDSSSVSPVKQEISLNKPVSVLKTEGFVEDKVAENTNVDFSNDLEELKNMVTGEKRKVITDLYKEPFKTITERQAKRVKTCNVVDIDSLFASHTSNQHGFGFIKHQAENMESDGSCSSYNNVYRTNNRRNDYKPVSFVKSNHVLDLNELNCVVVEEQQQESCDEIIEFGRQLLETTNLQDKDKNMLNKSEIHTERESITEVEKVCEENVIESSTVENVTVEDEEITKEERVSETLKAQEVSFDFEEDIDEIDKALCEALEAKKALGRAQSIAPSLPRDKPVEKEADEYFSSELSEKKFNSGTSVEVEPNSEIDMAAVLDLAQNLMEKLTFLVTNLSTPASLGALLVQLQTRFVDWQACVLESKYFMARLQEVNQYVYSYEMSMVSGNWMCQWDRENKRYYYTNTRTQQSQWTYPEELCIKQGSPYSTTLSEIPTSSASSVLLEQEEPPSVSSSIPETAIENNGLKSPSCNESDYPTSPSNSSIMSSPPPPPPGVDSPPPPPPCSPPPSSPPLPPPDSTETVCDFSEDMDLENSNDSCSPPIISNSMILEVNEIQYPSMVVCSSNSVLNGFVESVNSVSSTLQTICDDTSAISPSQNTFPIPTSSSNSASLVLWSAPQPSCSTEAVVENVEASALITTNVCSQSSESVPDICLTSKFVPQPCSSDDAVSRTNNHTSGIPVKKERKKTKLLAVMALKKKNIPHLVEKWRKIREEQEKEDKSDPT